MGPFKKLNISNLELEGNFSYIWKYNDGETVICPLTLEKQHGALAGNFSLNSLLTTTEKMWTFLFQSELEQKSVWESLHELNTILTLPKLFVPMFLYTMKVLFTTSYLLAIKLKMRESGWHPAELLHKKC